MVLLVALCKLVQCHQHIAKVLIEVLFPLHIVVVPVHLRGKDQCHQLTVVLQGVLGGKVLSLQQEVQHPEALEEKGLCLQLTVLGHIHLALTGAGQHLQGVNIVVQVEVLPIAEQVLPVQQEVIGQPAADLGVLEVGLEVQQEVGLEVPQEVGLGALLEVGQEARHAVDQEARHAVDQEARGIEVDQAQEVLHQTDPGLGQEVQLEVRLQAATGAGILSLLFLVFTSDVLAVAR